MSQKLVFDVGSPALAARLLADPEFARGDVVQSYFADFEVYNRLVTLVEGREVYVTGDMDSDIGFLRVYDTASAAYDEDALRITIAGSRSGKESAFEKRVRQRAFASIPSSPRGNRVVMCDPSSPVAPLFEHYNGHSAGCDPRRRKAALELANPNARKLVLSISSYDYLADRIVAAGGDQFERGEVVRTERKAATPSDFERELLMNRFQNKQKSIPREELLHLSAAADNEPTEVSHPLSARKPFSKLKTSVAGRHVVIVAGTINDPDTMDLLRLGNAVFEGGALSITMIVPYYGYSTMERKAKFGEAIKAKIRARLLSSVPRCPMGNRIVMCDLHAEAMPGCFEAGLKPVHLYCGKVIVQRLAAESRDWVLASADINRIKWVESMAKDGGVDTAYTLKVRKDGETRVVGQVGDVGGRAVRMFDDIIRTGGSAIGAAGGYLSPPKDGEVQPKGATSVDMIATHGAMPGGALAKLNASGNFRQIIVTDTHPRAVQLAAEFPEFLRVESVADIIVDHLTGRGFFATRTLG